MQPLVSICIPTYNRAECLEKTIESIIYQPEFKSGEVEIVISDNASTDATGEICEKYTNYPNFHYYRNSENIKDRNFSLALSRANGKLRKLNNDTFVLTYGSLKLLCNIVKEYGETRPFIFLRNGEADRKELNFHDFVITVGYWITWIASFTLWDDDCEMIKEDTGGCELSLWQVRKAYEVSSLKNSVIVYSNNWGNSISPPQKDISYGLYQVFYCNYMKLLGKYVEERTLSKDDIECLERELLFDFFPFWIIMYELKSTHLQYSPTENLKTAVWEQYKEKPYWREFKKYYRKLTIKTRIKYLVKRIISTE